MFCFDGKLLYMEKNIITINIPILFICLDDNKNKYLILCVDDINLRYLVVETTNCDLIDMLICKIAIREVFKRSKKIWLVEVVSNLTHDKAKFLKYDTIPEELLPLEGAYLGSNKLPIEEYIAKLKQEEHTNSYLKIID